MEVVVGVEQLGWMPLRLDEVALTLGSSESSSILQSKEFNMLEMKGEIGAKCAALVFTPLQAAFKQKSKLPNSSESHHPLLHLLRTAHPSLAEYTANITSE
jgi:hypothetical protein